MTLGSLFSGIGGIDLGFERAGFKVTWQVEIDKAARSILSRHYPDAPKFEDVCKVGKKQLSKVDVIAFGSPCQDFSVAGQRAGIGGKRSGLFFEAIRIVRQLRPSFAVWENVPGVFSSDRGRCFTAILSAFLECGARDIAWRVLDARYFDLAQRRERVFLVADFRGERAGEILFESACMCGNNPPRGQTREGVAATLRGGAEVSGTITSNGDAHSGFKDENGIVVQSWWDGGDIAGTLSASFGQSMPDRGRFECVIAHSLHGEGSDASEDGTGRGTPIVFAIQERAVSENLNAGPQGKGYQEEIAYTLESRHHVQSVAGMRCVRRLTPRECERLQGLPDHWTRYLADGTEQKDSPRYKQIGNGVAVPVLEWIARRIAKL